MDIDSLKGHWPIKFLLPLYEYARGMVLCMCKLQRVHEKVLGYSSCSVVFSCTIVLYCGLLLCYRLVITTNKRSK